MKITIWETRYCFLYRGGITCRLDYCRQPWQGSDSYSILLSSVMIVLKHVLTRNFSEKLTPLTETNETSIVSNRIRGKPMHYRSYSRLLSSALIELKHVLMWNFSEKLTPLTETNEILACASAREWFFLLFLAFNVIRESCFHSHY